MEYISSFKKSFASEPGHLSLYSYKSAGWMYKESVFDSRHGQDIFLFFTTSSSAVGPTQHPVHW
jgi:hypothetical protein